MIYIATSHDEYVCALSDRIKDTARSDSHVEILETGSKVEYRFLHVYVANNGCMIKIDQYVDRGILPYKVVPSLKLVGHDVCNIDLKDWEEVPGTDFKRAAKFLPFVPSLNGEREGQIVRLISTGDLPNEITEIKITNDCAIFYANNDKQINTNIRVYLDRYSFVNILDDLYKVEGLNMHEIIETINQDKILNADEYYNNFNETKGE